MGRFKLTLPWGSLTVIGQVVTTLAAAGLTEIVVVTGHRSGEVSAVPELANALLVYNPHYASGEMLSSIQAGLRALEPAGAAHPAGLPRAALLCLGDQPQMEAATVRAVLDAGAADGWSQIVIPSYRMRAGHPILLPAWLWPEILTCPSTLRAALAGHRDATRYLMVNTPTILADLDTPEDYESNTWTTSTQS